MTRISTFLCVAVCLVASQALADPPSGTVLLASDTGLSVRVDSAAAAARLDGGNVCGSAVNTGGVARATMAVRSGGRVFLSGPTARTFGGDVHLASADTPRPEPKTSWRGGGLGALLARVFGL